MKNEKDEGEQKGKRKKAKDKREKLGAQKLRLESADC